MKEKSKVQGEGDYEAAKRYNDETRNFAQKNRPQKSTVTKNVPQDEQDDLADAEDRGKARAKEEDPEIVRNYRTPQRP